MFLSRTEEDGSSQQDFFIFYCGMKQCHKQHAECVKSRSMVEHLDFVSLRHLWGVAGPSGRLLGWHHRGQCPRLGQVSAPTCQLCTPVKSTKLWTEPESRTCRFEHNAAWHKAHRNKQTTRTHTQKKVIWAFYLVQAFLPGATEK